MTAVRTCPVDPRGRTFETEAFPERLPPTVSPDDPDVVIPVASEHMSRSFWTPQKALDVMNTNAIAAMSPKAYYYYLAERSMGRSRGFVVNDLDLVKRILVDEAWPKSRYIQRFLWPIIRNGMFASNGSAWLRQRRLCDPALSQLAVRRAFPSMVAAADDLAARLDQAATSGERLDLDEAFTRVTADVIFRVLFSEPIDGPAASTIYQSFRTFSRHSGLVKMSDLMVQPGWGPYKISGKGGQAGEAIRATAEGLVRKRLESGDRPGDMLDIIIDNYREEEGTDTLPDMKIFDLGNQVGTLFLAGHETLASTLCWTIYLLSEAPACEEQMRQEVLSTCGTGPLEFKQVAQLAYVRAVLRETLRLYPPLPVFPREAPHGTKLRGKFVRRGDMVSIFPYFIHRHYRYWQDPEVFRPQRILPDRLEPATQTAYLPFSAGARVCPGAAFAMVEGPTILATLLRQFHFRRDHSVPVETLAGATLRPKNGLWVTVERV